MNLTPALARTQNQEEDSFEGEMLQGGLFKGFKRSLSELVEYQRNVQRRDASAILRSVSMETIQETSEIMVLIDIAINGIPCRGSPPVSPQLYPEWLLVRRHMCSDPHVVGRVNPLLKGYLFSAAPCQDSPQKGTKRARLHASFLVYISNYYAVVCF